MFSTFGWRVIANKQYYILTTLWILVSVIFIFNNFKSHAIDSMLFASHAGLFHYLFISLLEFLNKKFGGINDVAK